MCALMSIWNEIAEQQLIVAMRSTTGGSCTFGRDFLSVGKPMIWISTAIMCRVRIFVTRLASVEEQTNSNFKTDTTFLPPVRPTTHE